MRDKAKQRPVPSNQHYRDSDASTQRFLEVALTSQKAGESQVIDFFSAVLRDELQNKFWRDKKFSVGNFSGSQDRKFADFFAGTESNCVLIEFKEFEASNSGRAREAIAKNALQRTDYSHGH